ncbi:hypothetical protein B566_EDAN008210 [Ephemera danica]|nr:hypothetical protein B566_EDAN008210 [Ephemera danica]
MCPAQDVSALVKLLKKMDVDLLRTGTVPINPDTVLWFEFLLNPSMLERHLKRHRADPSPTELIIKFMSIAPDPPPSERMALTEGEQTGEPKREDIKRSKKSLALKIILPLPMQVTLLQDLLLLSQGKEVSVGSHEQLDITALASHELFAVLFYHRWVLRSAVGARLTIKQPRAPFIPIPGLHDPLYVPPQVLEEMLMVLEAQVPESLALLGRVTEAEPNLALRVPVYESFLPLSEDSTEMMHDWEAGPLSMAPEIHCQVHYDLGAFYFSREQYERSREHMAQAVKLFSELPENPSFCVVEEKKLKGYCAALGINWGQQKPDLLVEEVALVHRDALELDIQAAAASGRFFVARDLLMQVQILNAVRRAVEGTTSMGNLVPSLQQKTTKGLDFLTAALKAVLPSTDAMAKQRLRFFITDLVEAGLPDLAKRVLSNPDLALLLTPAEKNPKLQRGLLEESLIQSFDAVEIRNLITKLNAFPSGKASFKINSRWELPIPLQSVVLSLPKGYLQDITFILLAKAKELTIAEDFEGARKLLAAVDDEVKEATLQLQTVSYKLGRLVGWEVLLGNIIQFLAEWPIQLPGTEAPPTYNHTGDSVIPRLEVLEHCALALLNLGDWEYLVSLDRRWSYFELPVAIAHACQDIAKYKGTKKVSRRDAWELMLPVFGSSQMKRTSTGAAATSSHRDSPGTGSVQGRAQLQTFLSRLREPTAIAVAVSLLARLYNVLKDEPNLELNVEYVALWPAVVSNANSFSSRSVGEVLSLLLQQALKFYPGNVSWLKVLGDISFANGYYSSALKSYLESCIAVSGYFSQPMPRGEIDDQVYRRMIKCCTQLQCHTQAAVLCQFLDEIDYATAFKSLQEKSSADAMDAYYSCIWDSTLLEFLVHLHAKRGEQDRKQQANKIMGLLELNSNNNEEIRREAACVRKARFLRAMARHYVC